MNAAGMNDAEARALVRMAGIALPPPWVTSTVRTPLMSPGLSDLLMSLEKTNRIATQALQTLHTTDGLIVKAMGALDAGSGIAAAYLQVVQNVASAAATADRVLRSPAFTAAASFAVQTARISEAISASVDQLAPALRGWDALQERVADAAYGWRRLVDAAGAGAVTPAVRRDLVVGGRGALGVTLTAGALAGVELDVDRDLMMPRRQPSGLRAQLLCRLSEINPALPEKFHGAVQRSTYGGFDAASHAACSLVEVIDWTLRDATAHDDLRSWYEGTRPECDEPFDRHGRPTRALKILYLCRGRPHRAQLAKALVRMVTTVRDKAEGLKHSGAIEDPAVVADLLLLLEPTLFLIVTA